MNFDIRESPCSPHLSARSHDLELREGDYFQNQDHDAYARLLDTAIDDASSDHGLPAESEDFLRGSPTTIECTNSNDTKVRARRTSFMRGIALLCACSLSIGSHYAAHFLGPLKSRLQRELGTSHTEFGLLLSAYGLNSTWTPLVGGILANKLGTTSMSILATGIILIGQILLLLGDIWENVRLMALGLFIFGLGVSPVSVVQETIIVRFFKSHGLGLSMALGLIAGKGASFLSARTSYPLTDYFGPRAPFYVSTILAAFSVAVNLVYIGLSSKLVDGANAELEAADISHEARSRSISNTAGGQALSKMAKSHQVQIHQITKLGDIFWSYIGLNVFCGMIWSPFIQLAANIIQTRYKMSEEASANTASYLLSGSLLLYPLCGYIIDRHKHNSIIIQLLFLSSALTLLSYVWLALPTSWTRTPLFSILTFALGVGFSPLLLVVIVPKIVPSQYVSTALGAHKSMEQTGSILVQTLSGILLDAQDSKRKASSFQHLINAFIFLNTLQAGSIWLLAYLQYKKQSRASRNLMSVASSHGEIYRLSNMSEDFETPLLTGENSRRPRTEMVEGKKEIRRGKVIALASLVLIVFAWVLFVGVAWKEFGQKS